MTADLDIDLLRTFATVHQAGGFSQAADVLCRSQPAISLQIKRLEERVGAKVFERGGMRGVPLTPAGLILLEYARQIIALHDEALARLTSPKIKTFIRLGILEELGNYRLPAVLHSFSKVFPDANLQVQVKLSNHLLIEMLQGRLDIIVIASEADVPDAVPLWSEQLVWVASSSTSNSVQVPLPLVTLPEPSFYRRAAIRALNKSGQQWASVCTSSTMAGIRASVIAGLGITAMGKTEVTEGLRILGPEYSLPKLADADVVIYFRDKEFESVAHALATHIRKSIA
ncbi:LysR substrate-binding domain-containing protein [Dongia soli]|uniref:LysR substrate-binding domain-containing protein n=1 Tax=Dongia soli TaxID=600628 RepID=A0ABU5EB42_9PROT|nr:LysR substrate-binding domain-containing protein [Dongia soli]MDY0883588.1 LysR substrate-binding domain-containing protein [Dongia soli]